MIMRHKVLAFAAAGMMLVGGTSSVLADSQDNPTTADRVGFCISNNQRFFQPYPNSLGERRKESRSHVVIENNDNRDDNSICVINQDPS